MDIQVALVDALWLLLSMGSMETNLCFTPLQKRPLVLASTGFGGPFLLLRIMIAPPACKLQHGETSWCACAQSDHSCILMKSYIMRTQSVTLCVTWIESAVRTIHVHPSSAFESGDWWPFCWTHSANRLPHWFHTCCEYYSLFTHWSVTP